MKRLLRSFYLASLLDMRCIGVRRTLAEIFRRLTFRKHVVSVFLQLDDPYSYLLGHYLTTVQQRFKAVEFRVYLCQALRGDHMPEPALLAEYAATDCKLLAAEFGVPFLDKGDTPVVEYRRALLEFLAGEQNEEEFPATIITALTYYWRGDTEAVERLLGRNFGDSDETSVLVGKNQLLLRKMGHYNCATMHYAGEWYWGVDRLSYLVERLEKLRLNRYRESAPELASLDRAMRLNLPARIPARATGLPPLAMYHSFRSPYSYIALPRVYAIADSFGLRLEIKPVLPMAMRGMQVPRAKLIYIVRDANREAQRHDVPFGKLADPLGVGAERCVAAFYYARSQKREREFLLEAGKAIFAEAIDVATDDGLKIVAERCGLFWPELLEALQDDGWRDAATKNREDLDDTGLWGVPVLEIGDQAFWGQDRDWLVARKIEDLCDDGEGIMI